jgi:RNA polymerase sigma-70 factor (ECF subfamily)
MRRINPRQYHATPEMDAIPIQLTSAYEEGRRRWPDVELPLEAFAEHVQRLSLDEACLAAHGPDLFLVVASLRADRRAISHLDREYLREAARAVARIDRAPSFVDDVLQQVRLRLLTGAPPQLASYRAVGRLLDWVRVAAVRTALNSKRADHRIVLTEDIPLAELLAGGDADEEALRSRYLGPLQAALEEAFRRLAPRERNLLRMHFLDGMSLDALATMHGVHRATIARWLVSVRRSLVQQARGMLGEGAELSTRSVRSLYRLLAQDLHLSVSRLLAVDLAHGRPSE